MTAAAGGEAVKHGWQYWTFLGVGFVATVIVTIWVTKIARDALKSRGCSGINMPVKISHQHDRSLKVKNASSGSVTQPEQKNARINFVAQSLMTRIMLRVIPQEVIERDYGCGDPSRYLRQGEVVVDLGSGAGKICFIAAQIVGPNGKVIGVDMTDEMLEVARRNAPIVAAHIGVRER